MVKYDKKQRDDKQNSGEELPLADGGTAVRGGEEAFKYIGVVL